QSVRYGVHAWASRSFMCRQAIADRRGIPKGWLGSSGTLVCSSGRMLPRRRAMLGTPALFEIRGFAGARSQADPVVDALHVETRFPAIAYLHQGAPYQQGIFQHES